MTAARYFVCAALLIAACNEPDAGSPGLEPPDMTRDAGFGPVPGSGGSDVGEHTAGSGSGAAGTTSSPGGGAGGGGFGNSGAGGAGGSAGMLPQVDEDAGVDQPGTGFSADNRMFILYDCQQTVQCKLQRDEELPPDPTNACVAETSAELDANSELQMPFLADFDRCMQLVVCDYVDCVTFGP